MENIFDSAKFGDKFRTRDGKMVIYYTRNSVAVTVLTVFGIEHYHNDGVAYYNSPNEDIVSRWQEPINEEKLEEIANGYNVRIKGTYNCRYREMTSIEKEMFKAGYRAAKGE